jgi:prophage antirepressor-like protein
MNSLQIVENAKFGKVRFQMIENDPWFCAKDVCDVLGYGNSREALSKHVDKEDVTKCDTLTNGGKQKNTFINERVH